MNAPFTSICDVKGALTRALPSMLPLKFAP